MATVQSYLTYTSATAAAYAAWAQGIGTALTTLGWVKQSDTAGVTWANVTTLTNVPQYGTPYGTPVYAGAWTSGINYTVGNPSVNTQSIFSTVTDVGLTYACVFTTQTTGSTNGITALQNSAATLTVTAVAASSGQTAVYTVSSGVTAAMIGQQFVVTVGGSNLLANNAGTFVCTTTSGTTSITLGNSVATAQASVTGGSPGAQAISSTSVMSFYSATNGISFVGVTASNQLVGHTLVLANWTGGASGNNGSYTVTSNANIALASGNGTFCATFTGTNSTQISPAITITEGTHPASDPIHWVPYNYEIWKSNGPLSSTAPIYIKLVYAPLNGTAAFVNSSATLATPGLILDIGTAFPTTGQLGGNHITEMWEGFSSASGIGGTYECDFSGSADELAWILWRNGTTVNAGIPSILFIDRTKDQNGNTLSTFFTIGMAGNQNTRPEWVVFNQATGGVIPLSPLGAPNNVGWTFPIVSPQGLAYQGLTPVLPIFPIPGYVANPVLMAVAMKTNDFTDGQLVNAVLYGGSHTFLMSKSQLVDQPQLNGAYPGIRWE